MKHIPVLLKEVLEILEPKKGEFFIDCTFGDGGHALEILKRVGNEGKVLGVDWDKKNITGFKEKLKNLILKFGNYTEIKEMLGGEKADGLLADLGFSSRQVEDSGRGFSFKAENGQEPLLMTYSDEMEPVKDILRKISEKELADIIYQYGGERYSRRIAKAIKEISRKEKIETSGRLAEIVRNVLPKSYERGRIDRATRTFQALRIYANHELQNLKKLMENLPEITKSGARIAIITFHSLEDKIVKTEFKKLKDDGIVELLNKKPIIPELAEIKLNPRSRSAKLRAIIKI